jgi:hypothetical protein
VQPWKKGKATSQAVSLFGAAMRTAKEGGMKKTGHKNTPTDRKNRLKDTQEKVRG